MSQPNESVKSRNAQKVCDVHGWMAAYCKVMLTFFTCLTLKFSDEGTNKGLRFKKRFYSISQEFCIEINKK